MIKNCANYDQNLINQGIFSVSKKCFIFPLEMIKILIVFDNALI